MIIPSLLAKALMADKKGSQLITREDIVWWITHCSSTTESSTKIDATACDSVPRVLQGLPWKRGMIGMGITLLLAFLADLFSARLNVVFFLKVCSCRSRCIIWPDIFSSLAY